MEHALCAGADACADCRRDADEAAVGPATIGARGGPCDEAMAAVREADSEPPLKATAASSAAAAVAAAASRAACTMDCMGGAAGARVAVAGVAGVATTIGAAGAAISR